MTRQGWFLVLVGLSCVRIPHLINSHIFPIKNFIQIQKTMVPRNFNISSLFTYLIGFVLFVVNGEAALLNFFSNTSNLIADFVIVFSF